MFPDCFFQRARNVELNLFLSHNIIHYDECSSLSIVCDACWLTAVLQVRDYDQQRGGPGPPPQLHHRAARHQAPAPPLLRLLLLRTKVRLEFQIRSKEELQALPQ